MFNADLLLPRKVDRNSASAPFSPRNCSENGNVSAPSIFHIYNADIHQARLVVSKRRALLCELLEINHLTFTLLPTA